MNKKENIIHIAMLDGSRICITMDLKTNCWKKIININKTKIYLDLINFKEVTREEYLKLKQPKNKNNVCEISEKFRYGMIRNEYKMIYTVLNKSNKIMTKIELFKNKKLIYETALVNKNERNQNFIITTLTKIFLNPNTKDIYSSIINKIKTSKKMVKYPYYYEGIFK